MSKPPLYDPELATFGTETQAKYLELVNRLGSVRAASRELGVADTTILRSLQGLKVRAALRGYSPSHDWKKPVPETHVAKGVSTYYDADGKPRGQWVKADLKQEAYNEAVRFALQGLIEELPPLSAPPAPREYSTDVIPWIQIGDAHIGMLAHAAEVGESFDLKIAERELCAAIAQLIDEMPPCERVVVNDLGDFTHYENFTATTEASGHALDFDSRFPKMIRTYSRIMRFIIEKCLTKALHVDVIINQGNHSRTNDIWMAEALRMLYGHTDRVHVLDNDSIFIGYRMGKTFVMTHHSDKCKPAKLAGVMATDFAKDWGEAEFRYIDIGHIHHAMVLKEHPGVQVESWNILAAKDKYSHDGGWRSRQAISVVLRSRTYGEIGRRRLPIEEVRARLAEVGHPVQPPKAAFAV